MDNEAQRCLWCDVKRDAECGANCAGMHDKRGRTSSYFAQSTPNPGNLIFETFAAGWPGTGGILPEPGVTFFSESGEIVVTFAGPIPKILLGEFRHQDWIKPEGMSRIESSSGWTRIAYGVPWQVPSHSFQMRPIAEIGWSVQRVNCSAATVDDRMSD
jgi:hypothetical protein